MIKKKSMHLTMLFAFRLISKPAFIHVLLFDTTVFLPRLHRNPPSVWLDASGKQALYDCAPLTSQIFQRPPPHNHEISPHCILRHLMLHPPVRSSSLEARGLRNHHEIRWLSKLLWPILITTAQQICKQFSSSRRKDCSWAASAELYILYN